MKFLTKCLILFITNICSDSKTIRTKIYINENGTRELVFGNNSDIQQPEINSLLNILNSLNVPTKQLQQIESRVNNDDKIELLNTKEAIKKQDENVGENILMKHWNTLTEVGWKNFRQPVKTMYVNNTRILKWEPDINDNLEEHTSINELEPDIKAPEETEELGFDLCKAVGDLCESERFQENRQAWLDCLALKNETILRLIQQRLDEVDQAYPCSFQIQENSLQNGNSLDTAEETTANTNDGLEDDNLSSRALFHPKILLHKILLPLLVLIVIKYLVTLPFVAVTVFTLNAIWFGLLSLGAVLFSKSNSPERVYHRAPWRRLGHEEIYGDGTPASEVLWSPIRIPATPSPTGSQPHL